MANFTLVGFFEPFDLICSLKGRMGDFSERPGLRTIMLRGSRKGEPGEYIDSRELVRWPEMRAVLDHIGETAEKLLNARIEFGLAYVEMLDAGSGVRTQRHPSPFMRLIGGLRCNPGAYLWCPPEQYVLHPGEMVLTSPALFHGAVNAGDHSRINLVVDIRAELRRDTEEGEARWLRNPDR